MFYIDYGFNFILSEREKQWSKEAITGDQCGQSTQRTK